MAKNTNRNPRNKQTTKPEEVKLPVEDFMAENDAEEETSEPEVNEEEETSESEVLEETSTTEPVLKAKIVECNKLRLRTSASTSATVDRILEANNVLTLSGYDPKAEWTEVEAIDDVLLDKACFVMTKFIEVL